MGGDFDSLHDFFHAEGIQDLATWDGSTWAQVPLPVGYTCNGYAIQQKSARLVGQALGHLFVVIDKNLHEVDSGGSLLNVDSRFAPGSPLAVIEWNGQLVVAGSFDQIGGDYVGNIVQRSATGEWTPLGGGSSSQAPVASIYNAAALGSGLVVSRQGGLQLLGPSGWSTAAPGSFGRLYTDGNVLHAVHLVPASPSGSQLVNRIRSFTGLPADWTQVSDSDPIENADPLYPPTIIAMHQHEGDLYVGGSFSSSGATSLNNVAHLVGSQWEAMGSGLFGSAVIMPVVNAIETHNGTLVVGGSFVRAGAVQALNVAAWDGTQWSPLGSGVDGGVRKLASYRGSLYAMGAAYLPSSHQNFVMSWDGTSWTLVGDFDDRVEDLQVIGDRLVVTGRFTEVNGVAANRMVLFDGTKWAPFSGGGFDGPVRRVIEATDGVYFTGEFARAGSTSSVRLALWTDKSAFTDAVPVLVQGFEARHVGQRWTLRWQIQSDVPKVFRVSGEAGGRSWILRLQQSSSTEVVAIDRDRQEDVRYTLWQDRAGQEPMVLDEQTVAAWTRSGSSFELWPNPARGSVQLSYALPASGPVILEVFDLRGRRVRTLRSESATAGLHQVLWDGRDGRGEKASAGTYVFRLAFGGKVVHRRVSLVR